MAFARALLLGNAVTTLKVYDVPPHRIRLYGGLRPDDLLHGIRLADSRKSVWKQAACRCSAQINDIGFTIMAIAAERSLTTHRHERDFGHTPEPRGDSSTSPSHRYVMHKHAASHLIMICALKNGVSPLSGSLSYECVQIFQAKSYSKNRSTLAVFFRSYIIDSALLYRIYFVYHVRVGS